MPRSATPLKLLAGMLAAAGLAVSAAPAVAADGSVFPPNFRFGDGLDGFRLVSHGGVVNPGVLVGFNPQPDPPGDTRVGLPHSTLQITDGTSNTIFNPVADRPFILHFSVLGLGDSHLDLPPAPNSDGRTGFRHVAGDHVFDINFAFGPGPVADGSWVAFNPQPDPPGNWFSAGLEFVGDPWVTFTVAEDGQLLSFDLAPAAGAPEPGTWALVLGGLFAMGGALRLARRASITA
jgi:hypothetical protein